MINNEDQDKKSLPEVAARLKKSGLVSVARMKRSGIRETKNTCSM